jgi:sterol desaturase/sphingolipid hydroxylase (fatty acid hydroxylase superfamily)
MEEFILNNEKYIRMSFFFGIFLIMAIWELVAPRRTLNSPKSTRWLNNLGIVFLNSFILRLIFPTAAVGMALLAHERSWGLFNNFDLPYFAVVAVSIIALDMMIYLQHVMVHAVPALWRLHRMHHADTDIDVTTGARFHPIEIILSMLIKFSAIVVLGAPVVAVLIFEVLLNATAMFNHSNVKLPATLDRLLRILIVTPDMHRVHHSINDFETNSNFGFNLSIWDRIFGTYQAQPVDGHTNMTIGIKQFRDTKWLSLPRLLLIPFVGGEGDYSINRRKWDKNNGAK